MRVFKDWKFWVVIAFMAALLVGGYWYSSTHPGEAKPPVVVDPQK